MRDLGLPLVLGREIGLQDTVASTKVAVGQSKLSEPTFTTKSDRPAHSP